MTALSDEPPVVVCDATRVAPRGVLGLNDPDAGIVAVDWRPSIRCVGDLVHDLLDALGQTSGATGNRTRATHHQVPLLLTALAARPIRHVVIDDAHRASVAPTVALIQTCVATASQLTLATRSRGHDSLDAVLAAWPHRRATWTTRRRDLLSPPTVAPSREADDRFAGVPATEFPRFLTACADALPRDRYRRVEHHYHQLRIAAAAVLADHHQPEEVLAFTRRALRDATSTGHAIVICRAVTAAAFAHRVLLSANAATLAAALNHEPWFAARTNPRWSHLHRLRRPEHAAVAVLAACGLDAATIAGLTMADLDGLLMTAPDPARCHLRRLELHRLAQGADSTDGLLALADQRPVTARWVRTTHLAVTRDFDPPGADSAPHRRVREPDHLWARRLGIRVRVIT